MHKLHNNSQKLQNIRYYVAIYCNFTDGSLYGFSILFFKVGKLAVNETNQESDNRPQVSSFKLQTTVVVRILQVGPW